MRTICTWLILSALGLAGCGSEAVRKPSAPAAGLPGGNVQSSSMPGAQTAPALTDPYADPRLDPIRDKVPLVVRARAITAVHLSIDRRPTPDEKRAIRDWQEIRQSHHQSQAQPSAQLALTRVRVTRAITQLYAGRLTYAEFARRLQQIDAQHQAAVRQRLGQR